jgi:hypothetical protein
MKSYSHLLLTRRHQRGLWLRPLSIVGAGFLLALLLAALGAGPWYQLSVIGVCLVVGLAMRVFPRHTLHDTARRLDERPGARNRLEAVAELGQRTDSFATALRAEADGYFAQEPLPRTYASPAAIAVLAVLLIANVALLGPGWRSALGTLAQKPETVASKPAAGPALLKWVTPSEEISVAANEEVPLKAEAASAAGMTEVLLHVTRNGEPLAPISVTKQLGAGRQQVASTLKLAEMSLQPFDVVTYFLKAESTSTASPVSSPLQFAQVENNADVKLGDACTNCSSGCLIDVVRRLKREQIGVMRDSVALSPGGIPRTEPNWAKLVATVAERQSDIQQETTTIVDELTGGSVPREIVKALSEAKLEVDRAATELARAEPASAVEPEGRAIARFAAAERALAKSIVLRREAPPKETVAELPLRENTPAGRLEKLAAEQSKVAEQIATRAPAPNISSEQARLARDIAGLATEGGLQSSVTIQVKGAADAAKEAAEQLTQQDTLAASEPAARAAQALNDAVATMEAAGRARGNEELLATQRALLRNATNLQRTLPTESNQAAGEAAERVALIEQEAREAALRQQQLGSQEVAQRLIELAKAIAQSRVEKDLAALASRPSAAEDPKTQQDLNAAARKLIHLAQQGADSAAGFADSSKTLARALEELNRTQGSLDKPDARGASPRVGRDPKGIVDLYENALLNAQRLTNLDPRERSLPPPPGPGATASQRSEYAAVLSQRLAGLIQMATMTKPDALRPQILATGRAGEAPPAYRSSVASYFEALARDPAASQLPKQ